MADAQRHQNSPQIFGFGELELCKQFLGHLRRNKELIPRLGGVSSSALSAIGSLFAQAAIISALRLARLNVANRDSRGENVCHCERKQSGLGLEWRRRGKIGLGECHRTGLAKTLDIEGTATGDVLDAAANLRRATARIGAAKVDVALFGRSKRCLAFRAVRGHDKGAFGAVAQIDHRAEHLGNHVAGLAQHDRVADENPLCDNDVLIGQGCLAHH